MLFFDQLKKNDPQLRLMTIGVFGGICVLLAGLWWVQVVSAQDYREHLETQAYRTVRIPAVRGKILDRNGAALAENQPSYAVSLYLEELRDDFQDEYKHLRPVKVERKSPPLWKFWDRHPTIQTQRVKLSASQIDDLTWQARYCVASNVVSEVGRYLQQPLTLDYKKFQRHYQSRLALPYPIAENITPAMVARFQEQSTTRNGVDLEIQSARYYPLQTTASHLLGHLMRDDSSAEGEESYFTYRMPDFRGVVGVEFSLDNYLRGHAGAKSVLVNNQGYRQTENIWEPAEPGHDVVLTIDLALQQAAERALANGPRGRQTRGAAVIMDVNTGDILALASSPTFNPNDYIYGFPPGEYQRVQAEDAEKNRATQENYRPGSIFKPIVALACLENGMNPNADYDVAANPEDPAHGCIYLGRRKIKDTAPPGSYKFKRALIHSSNAYFIYNGLHTGVDKIVTIGQRFHLGDRIGLNNRQETSGLFPNQKKLQSGWTEGDTANLCIGQGFIDVTPLQMTVVAAAIANGGKVLWPRFVDCVKSRDPLSGEQPVYFPKGQVRDNVGVKPSTMKILQEAMLDDTENSEGTAYQAFRGSPVNTQLRVCGKTGTAQNEENGAITHTTWFLSFAPYEHPKYAVVVMVEMTSGGSGGATCAPMAREIYEAILKQEQNKSAVASPQSTVPQHYAGLQTVGSRLRTQD